MKKYKNLKTIIKKLKKYIKLDKINKKFIKIRFFLLNYIKL